jgi:SAM-dependent methyltransferase
MKNLAIPQVIRSAPRPTCYLCNQLGTSLYERLTDRMNNAPGIWNIKRCTDPQCGLLWLDPAPIEADLVKAYVSYFTHENSPKHAGDPASMTARLKWFVKFGHLATAGNSSNPTNGLLLKYLDSVVRFMFPSLVFYLPVKKKGNLLDVGCGDGDLIEAVQNYGWRSEGVDFDPAAVEFARCRGLNVRLGSLIEQNYESDHFEAIIINHVIEHVPDPLGMLKECRRILKPHGRLILATPNADSWFHHRFRQNWAHLDPPRHLNLFGISTMTELIRRAGFHRQLKCFTELGSPFIYVASELIRRNGRFSVGGSASISVYVRAALMILAELISLRTGREVGEELRLVTDK